MDMYDVLPQPRTIKTAQEHEEYRLQNDLNFLISKIDATANPADIEQFIEQLPQKVNHSVFRNQNTILHICAENGDLDGANNAISHGASVNATNRQDETPLMLAAYKGHDSIVRRLLEAGADASMTGRVKGKEERTALHWAAANNKLSCCITLLEFSPGTLNTTCKNGDTALHLAAKNGHDRVVILLVARGANAKTTNCSNHSPLYIALTKEHYAIVYHLLATAERNVEDISEFIRHRISVIDSNNHKATTALQGILLDPNIELGVKSEIISSIIECGSNLHAFIKISGHTLLHWAISNNHFLMAYSILRVGDITHESIPEELQRKIGDGSIVNDITTHLLNNKIHAAVILFACQMLLDLRQATATLLDLSRNPAISIDVTAVLFKYSLMSLLKRDYVSEEEGEEEEESILIDYLRFYFSIYPLITYTIPNKNMRGLSPLMLAVIHERNEIVRAMINAGARLDIQDDDGRTAIHHAAYQRSTDVFYLLSREDETRTALSGTDQDKKNRIIKNRFSRSTLAICDCQSNTPVDALFRETRLPALVARLSACVADEDFSCAMMNARYRWHAEPSFSVRSFQSLFDHAQSLFNSAQGYPDKAPIRECKKVSQELFGFDILSIRPS